ncbi:MAG: ABC transporter permease [Sporolactobacillus sp.]|nr:ABC transporter permease [Sporolactobacillus sp.]
MGHYISKRLIIAAFVIFSITVINFILINMIPGNPADILIDPNLSAESIAAKKEMLGLDSPMYMRYIKWIINLFHGNLGYSLTTFQPVSQIIVERIGPTLLLNCSSFLVGLFIAIPLGIESAKRAHSKMDHLVSSISLFAVSVPSFIFALFGLYFFSVVLRILPSAGMYTIGSSDSLIDRLVHLILPVSVLSLGVAGVLVRYCRASMIEVMGKNYLLLAKAQGFRTIFIDYVLAFKNALTPLVSVTGTQLAGLLGGSVVIEQIFSWPGLGQLAYQSITNRDYSTLMGICLVTSIMVTLANLITDLIYPIVDPRVKHE